MLRIVATARVEAEMRPYAVAISLSLSLSFSIVMCLRIPALSSYTISSSACHPSNQPHPRTLRSDQFTVLINGYSQSRLPLLQSIAATYSASPLVFSVLVLWGNPSTPPLILAQLAHNLSVSSRGSAAISLVSQPSSSLNARFLPRSSIGTRAVLVCDDDVEVDPKTVEFAFRMWRGNPERLIGIFVRSHEIDMARKEWIYTVHPDKYSIVLTKFMMMKTEYLFKYSCGGGGPMREMRRMVDEMRNCEDILMNFVVAEETNAGPLMVGAERARDWGDPRNEDDDDGIGVRLVRDVGLSSRRAEHRKRRGDCITEFHRVIGRMPLRYSYGKLVSSVGEQGLCRKGGKVWNQLKFSELIPSDVWFKKAGGIGGGKSGWLKGIAKRIRIFLVKILLNQTIIKTILFYLDSISFLQNSYSISKNIRNQHIKQQQPLLLLSILYLKMKISGSRFVI